MSDRFRANVDIWPVSSNARKGVGKTSFIDVVFAPICPINVSDFSNNEATTTTD